MVSEGKGREYKSDVPELEAEQVGEDKEVIQGKETSLHEELGFESAAQMEQARAKQAELLKEKDQAKADKLRAELRAMLDDAEGEPAPAEVRSNVADLVAAARQDEQRQRERSMNKTPGSVPVDSPLEMEIAKAEKEEALALGAQRLVIEQMPAMLQAISAESDPAKADVLRQQVEAFLLGKTLNGTRELSETERIRMDKRFAKVISNAEKALAEAQREALETPDDQLTPAEKLGQRRFEAAEKNYEEAVTEAFKSETETATDDRDENEDDVEQKVA